MPNTLPDYKRRALQTRLNNLIEEYEAVNNQLSRTLSDVDRLRLRREGAHLDKQIQEIRQELAPFVEPGVVSQDPHIQQLQDEMENLKRLLQQMSEKIEGNAAPDEQPFSVLRVQLLHCEASKMEIRGLKVPGGGEPKAEVDLPFSFDELKAVLKALDVGAFVPERFKAEYVQALENMGLLHDNRLHAEFHKIVGQKLYRALFAGPMQTELSRARDKPPVACQLCFDPEDTLLAQFPWEVLHDGSTHPLLTKNGLELTRYITFGEKPTPFKVAPPLKVLFVMSRPDNEDRLPDADEVQAITKALEPLRQAGKLDWEYLNPPTWDALESTLNHQVFHIVHFDGHGTFARRCPVCDKAHYPNTTRCVACQGDMSDNPPKGYLHFEDDAKHSDPVSVDDLTPLFHNADTRLVVLSACGSAVTQGTSVFNGVAPGLIQAGIPAVLGMQGSPPVKAMVKFFERVYSMLAESKRLPDAVNSGRRAIFRDKPPAWFMPIVYLRSSDDTYGQLFAQ